MLHARLMQLGAVEVCPRGLSDEQSPLGMEGDLDAWLVALWGSALKLWPLPPGVTVSDAPVLSRSPYHVAISRREGASRVAGAVPVSPSSVSTVQPCPTPRGVVGPMLHGTVVSNDRITAVSWQQDVRHIAIDVADSGQRCGCPAARPRPVCRLLSW
jgi:hypothetical protein